MVKTYGPGFGPLKKKLPYEPLQCPVLNTRKFRVSFILQTFLQYAGKPF